MAAPPIFDSWLHRQFSTHGCTANFRLVAAPPIFDSWLHRQFSTHGCTANFRLVAALPIFDSWLHCQFSTRGCTANFRLVAKPLATASPAPICQYPCNHSSTEEHNSNWTSRGDTSASVVSARDECGSVCATPERVERHPRTVTISRYLPHPCDI